MRWLPVHPWKAGLVCLAAAAGLAHAGDIYKSLDANGNVSYSDHADPSKTQTPVVLPEDPRYPPRQMHVCGTRNCFTLMLDNGSYRRADGTDDTWTIESFTPRSVVLRRHGAITGNTDVTYSGDVVNDRLVNVRVNGAVTGGIDASWGAALNTLPGNHAEPDASSPANGDNSLDGGLSTAMAPPPIPPEDQPEIPEPGYLWTPGYWYWRNHVYSWVPGTWLRPPQTGFFWTPGYWRLVGTLFVFRPGYWGPSVGFYGGINYGHGYGGTMDGRLARLQPGRQPAERRHQEHLSRAAAKPGFTPSRRRGERALLLVADRIELRAAAEDQSRTTDQSVGP